MSPSQRDYDGTEIAVCGLAGRFPGAPDVESLWKNLCAGVESITRFSPEELREAGEDPEKIADPRYVPVRPVLAGAELFDASFFGFSPREAEVMDPQHRVFLEVAWEALEDAGYDTTRFDGRVSLFAGTSFSNYLVHNLYKNRPVMESHGDLLSTIHNVPDSLATMVGYKLGLKGACCSVQTFCSTSLVGVHLACQSLLNYESDAALAGGVSIFVPQARGYLHEPGSIVSREGRCRAFDARADGTVFGNGAGVVVLRRLEDATKAGDRIRAVILGSAVNNDGPVKASFAAPAVVGQTEVVVEALAAAGVDADSIGCVEAHGTGTRLGDPAEVSALTKAFRTSSARRGFCALGSVKTNVGHLDAAAGVTGLIKMVRALEEARIPPSLHFQTPNPEIDFEASPFFVNTALREWTTAGGPRRAGVSAFGVGGTNAHVVLEEAPAAPRSDSARPAQLLLLSARSETALERASLDLARHLESRPELSLADVAWTLQVGRRAFDRRRAAICRGREDAIRVLRGEEPGRTASARVERRNPAVVLVFPDADAQPPARLRELCAAEPRLREEIERAVVAAGERSAELRRSLEGPGAAAKAGALIVQVALARRVLSWGVRPDALVAARGAELAARVAGGELELRAALEAAVDGSTPTDPPLTGTIRIPVVARDAPSERDSRISIALPASLGAEGLLEAARDLWLAGVELDWAAVHDPERRHRVSLPTYPFERERFWVDPLPEAAAPAPPEPGPADWLYRSFWKSALAPRPVAPGRHLVLLDGEGSALGLIERLRAAGDEVVTVRTGTGFGSDASEGYRIDPARGGDYQRLWEELEERGRLPRSVVDARLLDAPPSRAGLGRAQSAAERFDAVRHLAAAATRRGGDPVALRVLARGLFRVTGDESLHPELAPLLGLLRVLPQESEGLRCALVDVGGDAGDAAGALADALAREVRSPAADPVVALRAGSRWVQGYERLEESRGAPAGAIVRAGGVYLVTGGLGSVGLVHAAALARQAPVKLVLTARTPLPPREDWDRCVASDDTPATTALRIRAVRALEAEGSQILTAAVDAADETAMAGLIRTVHARFGPLNGVVYAAGELHRETFLPVRALTTAARDRHFGPKLDGLLLLDRLLDGEPLDFVLLTSSLSTVLGGYGYAAYAGANAFLDAYAEARSADGVPWLSVDWDHWLTAGEGQADSPGLAPSQGFAVVERLLTLLDARRLIVSMAPLEPRLRRWVDLDASAAAGALAAAPPRRGAASAASAPPSDASDTSDTSDTSDIEQALLEHAGIASAAVVRRSRSTGRASLAAYVAYGSGAEPTVTELRTWLKERLPADRVPASFVALDALPLAGDGSPDRGALERLEGGTPATVDGSPRTEMETRLAGIWREALGRERVSVDDNFFDLGGHSLLSVRVATRIEKELGIQLDPRDLIFQTLGQLAIACEQQAAAAGGRR